ncbi:MAG: hypothetical protein MPEBLZ_00641 [Candidatus Methanoperedens nitroreducens]|uniref:Uncharacterized protein n=1 Tax=Candidatus Methanoperedens nitratireducens TaxID=1392998 RepID=A0A0P8CMN4_9EURY|nr:hypothetical protein [Candidatus Methanoperedens sp. BLZ2]KAB2944531.1 MAG: hypothetical protein F9K14_14395 [Candidatus Methanoperedens sp.]KPQ44755.1 MAG: hypothetical protein MPEBLZ_00641 [Candidatus Methanoperedens sp. BLZ1]MBZ0176266.1 hypothetical protein [Candidatus Methanoperedens nitroreducens]CAG0974639.1 hypothetical protein METP2_01600 [Methanosarcinales archaeon]MCX9077199.1 hypothetical protein [Candidatus Methanoperedens sp.]
MTTGIWLFSKCDVEDWSKFLKHIKSQVNSDSPTKCIWKHFSKETQEFINAWNEDKKTDPIKFKIIDELNTILLKKDFYDDCIKPYDIIQSSNKIESSDMDDTIRKNRRLIEEIFSGSMNKYEKYYEKLIDQRCIRILEGSTQFSDIIEIGKKSDNTSLFTNIIFHPKSLVKKDGEFQKCLTNESKYTKMCDVVCEKSLALVKFIQQNNKYNNIIFSPYIPSSYPMAKILGDSNAHKKIIAKITDICDLKDVKCDTYENINIQDNTIIFAINYRPEIIDKIEENLIGIILVLGLAHSIKEKINLPDEILNKIHEVISIDEISNNRNLRHNLVKKTKAYD